MSCGGYCVQVARSDEIFDSYDHDRDGRLNDLEITDMLSENEMDDTPESVAALIARFDVDGSGDLDKVEFRPLAPQIGYRKTAMGWIDKSSFELRPLYVSTG